MSYVHSLDTGGWHLQARQAHCQLSVVSVVASLTTALTLSYLYQLLSSGPILWWLVVSVFLVLLGSYNVSCQRLSAAVRRRQQCPVFMLTLALTLSLSCPLTITLPPLSAR